MKLVLANDSSDIREFLRSENKCRLFDWNTPKEYPCLAAVCHTFIVEGTCRCLLQYFYYEDMEPVIEFLNLRKV